MGSGSGEPRFWTRLRDSAWLDTFQARDFYLGLGYETFGVLDNYPPGQQRTFMRKVLRTP